MHRLFMPPAQLAPSGGTVSSGAPIRLTAEQTRYLRTVLRLEQGALLEVFDGHGARFSARLEGDSVVLTAAEPDEPLRKVDLVLVQALAKGEKMDVIVQKATELGAARIVPLGSERSVVKLDAERSDSRTGRYRRIAQEAARQCGRADVPQIDPPADWDAVFALLASEPTRLGLLLDPEAAVRLSQVARGAQRLLLAVGPEGGFSTEERARAQQAGMIPVGLGKLVLRTETAALAALAVVQHVHGELG